MADEDLRQEISRVLSEAKTGRGSDPGFLTAYQILLKLPEVMRQGLLDKYGTPGKGAETHYSAASRISTALEGMQGEVEKAYFDPTGVKFEVGDDEYRDAGYGFVGIYRQRPSP